MKRLIATCMALAVIAAGWSGGGWGAAQAANDGGTGGCEPIYHCYWWGGIIGWICQAWYPC